jgi:Flp pilus assembly protein TadG
MRLSLPRLTRRVRRGQRDQGSVAVWTVVFAIAVLFLTALIVDGGIAMNARSRATDIAGQAARAAADDINVPVLRETGQVRLDPGACTAAASLVSSYAGQDTSGVNRVTTVVMENCSPGADSATVEVRITTEPLIPGVFGGFTETATQTATAECGITQGVEC